MTLSASHSQKLRLLTISVALMVGILIFGIKLYAAWITNSSALRSDALEGTVNILAAAFGLFSILYSEKPADHDHPYGHGKIEHFAAIFEGGLISLAGFLILIDTGMRIVHNSKPENLEQGLFISFAAGALNGLLGFILYLMGKKHNSTTLRSDGLHLLSDFGSTIGLSLGLGLALLTGWTWLDPLLAVLVGVLLFIAGYKVFKPSWNTLLDAINPESIDLIVKTLQKTNLEPIITVHELKMQEFGRDAHVDLHLVMPEFFTLNEAHALGDRIVAELQKALGSNSQIHAHLDPCARYFCSECTLENCPIRMKPFVAKKPLSSDSITLNGPF